MTQKTRDVYFLDENFSSRNEIKTTDGTVVIKFVSEQPKSKWFKDNLLLRIVHSYGVQKIVIASQSDPDLKMLIGIIRWFKNNKMFKIKSSLYFPLSTTRLHDLYSFNKQLKDSHLSASVIKCFTDEKPVLPPIPPEKKKEQKTMAWARIRMEPTRKKELHGCIGFTPEELQPYQDQNNKRKAKLNSTTTNDTGDTSQQKKIKLLKSGLSEQKTNQKIEKDKKIRKFLLYLTKGMARDQEVTLIDDKEFKLTITRRS